MFKEPQPEQVINVAELVGFDKEYFEELEGVDGWNALEGDYYIKQQYFTVLGDNGEKLGIIGIYDTEDEQNVTHTVVDPKFRGKGLAAKFKDALMDELDIEFITLTIDLDNEASIRAAEKLPGVRRVSSELYESDYHKAKYIYERRSKEE